MTQWKNIVQPDRPQMKIQYGSFAVHAETKVTNTLSQYIILIAFPQQQWLCERATMLRYTYVACLVRSVIKIALLFFVHTYGVSAFCFLFLAASISYIHSTSVSLYGILSSFQALSQSVENRLLAYLCLFVCSSVCPTGRIFREIF